MLVYQLTHGLVRAGDVSLQGCSGGAPSFCLPDRVAILGSGLRGLFSLDRRPPLPLSQPREKVLVLYQVVWQQIV